MKPSRLFPYYGAKWRIGAKYPPPIFDRIVEPFCGSAAYSARYGIGKEVHLFDTNVQAIHALQFLIESKPEDILSLPLLAPGQSVDSLSICNGARALLGFWIAVASIGGCKRMTKWAEINFANGQIPVWGERARARLATMVAPGNFDRWHATIGLWSDLPRFGPETTWFIDPPYIGKSGSAYKSEPLDYQELAIWCSRREGQVIVCENNDASWLPFKPLTHLMGAAGHRRTQELIWTNI